MRVVDGKLVKRHHCHAGISVFVSKYKGGGFF
jgi:hypothetical protein